jgi:xanthosine utilization system XapX-like protein
MIIYYSHLSVKRPASPAAEMMGFFGVIDFSKIIINELALIIL